MTAPDLGSLRGKRVFLTGHTGFKGSWMVALLDRLGAKTFGYALAPEGGPNLFDMADIGDMLESQTIADIRDPVVLSAALEGANPDLVIHMAAQAFVRRSYGDPVYNWDVNVMGTVNVLDAARRLSHVQGVIIVTTDKCYENKGWDWGYRETDALGGHDPYSASKAAAEIAVQSYRRSFFADSAIPLVSVRAGNVIGGGDWSPDRLIPDAARAAASATPLIVRNPRSTRPWQHVLDCLAGYLSVACQALQSPHAFADAYNFGPGAEDNVAVGEVLSRLQKNWPELTWEPEAPSGMVLHEASQLYLDSARARHQLQWRPRWTLDKALEQTANWYRKVQGDPNGARSMTLSQIEEFLA